MGRNSGITYLRNGRSEYHNFVQLANSLHEFINTRSFYDVYVVIVSFNLNRDGEICLVQDLLTMLEHMLRMPTLHITNLE